jgi:NAD(P)-dependent dehydrogenase (short-subunit alcohol dehydrogenase family)
VAIPDVTSRSLQELVSLDGRVAVVTGGARGTGAGIVRRLADGGARLVIGDGDLAAAEQLAREMSDTGYNAMPAAVEMDDESSVAALADFAAREQGGLDIWVNNAGIYPGAPFLDMSAESWDEVLEFNLKGAFLGSREAARRMVAAGRGGVIINIGSTSSFRASTGGIAHYVASKFGLRGLTQALAVELGPHGIRVLAVAPTFTVTPGTRARRADLDDDAFRQYIERTGAAKPLGRVAVPDDVARVVLFCATDLAGFMTGSTLPVDGGDLAR